jgi:glycosyltransferase involved in cell wall biosynthesis
MTDEELQIPTIEPVPPGVARPRWSILIPAFNGAATIAETLSSVLEHGPAADDAQIAVVDNVSTDATLAVVDDVLAAHGVQNRVEVIRNATNLGMAGNWTECIRQARGEFVHILHADDFARAGFYAAVEAAFAERPEADLCLVRALVVDWNGEAERLAGRKGRTGDVLSTEALAYGNEFYTPGVVVRRACYERIGGFSSSLMYVPDWEMWLRILAQGCGVYVNESLVCYREAAGNLTNRYSKTAEDIRELEKFGAVLARRVPGFVPLRWRSFLKQHAVWAMANWKRAGDTTAYETNRVYWRKFASPGEKLDVTLAAAKRFGKECERPLRTIGRRLRGKGS